MTDPDYPALLIADHVLGGHFYSRLYEALRHEAGDTYGAVTRMRTELEPGTYMLWTFTKTANAASTEAKLRGVLERFHAQGITEAERSAAAGYLLGRRAFDRQSPAQVLERHVWEIVRGLPAGFRDGLAERAAALRVEDINAFIHRFHDPARFTLVEAVPK